MKHRKWFVLAIMAMIVAHGLVIGQQWWTTPMVTALAILVICLPTRQGE